MNYSARSLFFLLAFASLKASAFQKEIPIRKGEVIRESVKIQKGTYIINNNKALDPVLIIEGDNITIDFNGAILTGSTKTSRPDHFSGIGILIRKGKNIILKNAVINGFKIAVKADSISGLQVLNSDFSWNFRQKLKSNRFREDMSDWQSYHKNDKEQWLRFGAGIYLLHCDSATISDVSVTNGQCGLMMSHTRNSLVKNNNFSFNSGLGIGMHESHGNTVINNRVDWNVRGYSHGYYYRGQDSGGILVFNNSSNNVFAFNSVTHSGDGFFLWAGDQYTSTGVGGCNDNLVYDNDFSYAPTNAVEITFSRNKIINNRMHGCWHGIWGGFSYNTVIVNNDFGGNLAAISIEHGQDNIIEGNSFTRDSIGIELWANRTVNFAEFMKKKDTRSRNYIISGNQFKGVPVVYDIKNSSSILLSSNTAGGYRTLMKKDSLTVPMEIRELPKQYDPAPDSILAWSLLGDGQPTAVSRNRNNYPQGKEEIRMTEWGPYNYAYPLLWWTHTDKEGKMYFDILGPEGRWKMKNIKGVRIISSSKGSVPGKLVVKQDKSQADNLSINLEYRGQKVTSPFGEKIRANKPYLFGHHDNTLRATWNVKWFEFSDQQDPAKQETAFRKLISEGQPVKTATADSLNFVYWNGLGRDMPQSKLVTIAETTVKAPKGKYILGVTAGDLVRVYVDDKLVIDSWTKTAIKFDSDYYKEAEVMLSGTQKIKIIQAQYGGYGMLSATIKKQ